MSEAHHKPVLQAALPGAAGARLPGGFSTQGPRMLRGCHCTCRIFSFAGQLRRIFSVAGSGGAYSQWSSQERSSQEVDFGSSDADSSAAGDGTSASNDSRAASHAGLLGATADGPGSHCNGIGSDDGILHCRGGWGQRCDSVPSHDSMQPCITTRRVQ